MIREERRRDAIELRRPATRVSFHLPSTTSHDIKSHEPPRGTRRYAHCRKKLHAYAIVSHFSIMWYSLLQFTVLTISLRD